jgi:hypothetical protein
MSVFATYPNRVTPFTGESRVRGNETKRRMMYSETHSCCKVDLQSIGAAYQHIILLLRILRLILHLCISILIEIR